MQCFLSASETNAEAELSLPLLTTKIIDISTAHANALGIGNPSMAHMGCGWVLSRLAVEMSGYPKVNDTYKLTTWIESYNRHFSERIVMISDSNDRPLGYSRAIWMILDYNTRESVGLEHLALDDSLITPGRCPIARQGKHVIVYPADYEGEVPRGAMLANTVPFDYRYKYCDLDFYRHVNTVRYIELLLNRYPLQTYDRTCVSRMELAFMHEGRFDQEVSVLRHDTDTESWLSIVDRNSGEASIVAKLTRKLRN